MARIAIVDIMFHWPPIGGAWVDLANVITGLQERGNEVKLFAPDFPEYFQRGRIEGELPFEYETIPFNRFSFNFITAPKRFRQAVDKFQPDYVMMGDGYFMKPWLAKAFEKKFKTIIRFFAYEIICAQNCFYPPKVFGPHTTTVRPGDFCDTNFFENPDGCKKCFMPAWRFVNHAPRLIRKRKGTNVELQYYQEWVGAVGFTKTYQRAVKSSLANAHAVITYNNFGRRLLEPHAKRVEVIPGGVKCSDFGPAAPTGAVHGEKAVILFTGRMDDPVKGLEIVKGALNILASRRDDFSLLITAGPHVPASENYCYRAPWIAPDRMPEIYRKGDIFVVAPLWQEPFGLIAVEAMASGLPVIATRVGGLQTIVEDGVTGFLVEPGDSLALSEKIKLLLDNPKLRQEMGAKGRERAEKVFDWDVVIDKHYMPLFE
ncbi:glycosyltransferase [Candidatus Hydrogenedentota bacterium]